jgi:HlyD family secretion protein
MVITGQTGKAMHDQVVRSAYIKQRKRRPKWWFILTPFILAIVAFFFTQRNQTVIEVTSEKAAIRDLTQVVSATGKIRPRLEVKISPEVAGEIIELPVTIGKRVRKGDLLMKIMPDPYIAAVRQAQASLDAAQATCLQDKAQMLNAQLDLHRADDLYHKSIESEQDYKAAQTKAAVSQAQYEAALHQIDVAKSALDQQKTLLDKCIIYSPIDGMITMLESELGERVVATSQFPGTEVMRIGNLSVMEARVEVNENDIVNVSVGDPVKIQADAYPDQPLNGVLREIAITATVKGEGTQQEVTNFEVRITVENPDVALRPGMSVSADIRTKTVRGVISIPIECVTVRSREDGKTQDQIKAYREKDQPGVIVAGTDKRDESKMERVVFVRRGDVVNLVAVKTGIADDNYVQIISGLHVGDEVITGSYTAISKNLKTGSKVTTEKSKLAQ